MAMMDLGCFERARLGGDASGDAGRASPSLRTNQPDALMSSGAVSCRCNYMAVLCTHDLVCWACNAAGERFFQRFSMQH